MAGRPRGLVELSDDERACLTRWARRGKLSQTLVLRSKIVLLCAEGLVNTHVAQRLGVSRDMVGKWRGRFLARRLEGLVDEPRPGRPRRITDDRVEEVIVKTLEQQPADKGSRWSTRSMARETGLSQTAVSRIWRASGLKPHLIDNARAAGS